jgi:parallel beta-helix repeat protein
MKKIVICIFLLSLSARLYAQNTYYVSATGNDSNTGTSANQAFKTINKINQLVLKAGDAVLFKKGDIFRGQLVIQQSGTTTSPIVIDGYGSGSNPVISGAVPVKGWRKTSGNIWEASCQECLTTVAGVFADNRPLPLGTYPNQSDKGHRFLTIQSHVNKTQLTSNEPLLKKWEGAEVVMRKNLWTLDRAKVLKQNGNTLTITEEGVAIKDNWGFFLQNHPSALDQNGEWCYDASKKSIQLYSNTDPNNSDISASVYTAGISVKNAANVTIQNITLTQGQKYGIHAQNVSGITVKNSTISDSGQDGVFIQGKGRNITLENNVISGCANGAVMVKDVRNFTLRKNTIKNIGLIPGLGRSGSTSYAGVTYFSSAGTSLMEENTLDSIGYHGIYFQSTNITIRCNLIKNYNYTKSDGGGIYTFSGKTANNYVNQKIVSNIILSSIGAYEGTYKANLNAAHGIYLDDCSHDIEVKDNTVANCNASGIFLHGTYNVTVTNNTCYNNATQIQTAYSDCGEPHDNKILDNIFVSKTKEGLSRNIGRLLRTSMTIDRSNKTMDDQPAGASRFEYNASTQPKQIPLNGKYRDLNNKVYEGKVTLQPYTSIILMK